MEYKLDGGSRLRKLEVSCALVLALAPTIGQAELVASIQSNFFFLNVPKKKFNFLVIGGRGHSTQGLFFYLFFIGVNSMLVFLMNSLRGVFNWATWGGAARGIG